MRQKTMLVLSGILAIYLMFPGIINAEKKYPDIVVEMVDAAKKDINKIDMATFRQVVDKKDYDLLIDAREPDEYAEGHVPGAINIPRGVIEFKIWKEVGFPEKTDIAKKIYINCRTGGRASLSTKALKDLGFTNVTAVIMKMEEWIEAGHPIEK